MAEERTRAPSLAERLRSRIAAEGPVTFAAFMEAALYDPEEGFYSRAPVGVHGDFVTSPHVSTLFGALLARQVVDFWNLLERPDPFDVLEVGAGTGELARSLLGSLPDEARTATRYRAVDRSAAARSVLRSLGLDVASAIDDVAAPLTGCVLANELLDNLPFHRVRMTDRGLVELYVAAREGRFVLVEGTPSSEDVAALAPPGLDPGQEGVVAAQAVEFVRRAAGAIGRGYLLLIDYGWLSSGDRRDLVHAYLGHRTDEDVLADPGSRDITAGVDFAALAAHARKGGFPTWGPVTQREALLALGFREWHEEARQRQVAAIEARRGIDALRLYSERTRANLLLNPVGLGTFYVLCIGVGVDPGRAPLFAGPARDAG